MSFADNLIYLRQHYGVTQEGLAEQLSVSRQTISKWEAGTNYPEMDKLLTLCDLFHTNLDDLMRGSVQVANANDTERYDRHMNQFDAAMVGGVMCVLIGVSVIGLLQALHVSDNLQAAAMLSCVVVGVVLLVVAALNHSEFKRRNPDIEPHYSTETLDQFGRRFPILIGAGVGLILLDVIFLVALSPDNETVLIAGLVLEDVLIAPFMLVMALAVGILIWAGMQKSKYDLSELTYVGHSRAIGGEDTRAARVKTPEQMRVNHTIGGLCGAIMILATIVFLVWGFVPLFEQVGDWSGMDKWVLKDAIREGQGGFAISWIAFVVGGLLCGVVAIVSSIFTKSNDDILAEARREDAWVKVIDDHTNDPEAKQ